PVGICPRCGIAVTRLARPAAANAAVQVGGHAIAQAWEAKKSTCAMPVMGMVAGAGRLVLQVLERTATMVAGVSSDRQSIVNSGDRARPALRPSRIRSAAGRAFWASCGRRLDEPALNRAADPTLTVQSFRRQIMASACIFISPRGWRSYWPAGVPR